jgi:hypothetical protein
MPAATEKLSGAKLHTMQSRMLVRRMKKRYWFGLRVCFPFQPML